ncbi:MAG TPA: diguanylate cyclase [Thiobacillus sp.]|nr:MAG: diguanylate cyclase [Hydrogenophilales bacterium 28-61-11]OYZ58680.1 MAG: diguanylate cyclase [Hydrogenophilales bacterium 16-61-112]OZA45155.1 MAG: diguanylate cyclase [Hydrogenophilales bacterium 17-61-76]HQT30790.1 diguanylate cyclase [Thiobacillus sp.]HQT69594.1 diguanylate cyclase [Thiobacillus sp.]
MKTTPYIPPDHVMDLLLDAVCVVDAHGCFVFVSAAGERIFGYPPEEMIGKPVIDFVFHEDRERTLQAVGDIVKGQAYPHFENRYVRRDGQVVHLMWSARWSETDQVRVAVARDVTELKRVESLRAALYAMSEAAHATEDLLALFQRIHQIVGGLVPAGGFFVALYDAAKDELSFPYHVDEQELGPATSQPASATLSAEVIRSGKVLLLPPDAAAHSMSWLGVPLATKSGIIGSVAVQTLHAAAGYGPRDVELLQFVSTQIATAIERKQMEMALLHRARHDPLTDLPNRELFHDRLQAAMLLAGRNETRLALLYLDLDRFKQVNDSLGHPVGDLLLQETARRLRLCVRDSDTVGRVGGDEFLVLLNGIPLHKHAASIAEKIRVALDGPFTLAGQLVHVSPSIGIALYPDHGHDYRQLIRSADAAMYAAKKAGGNRFVMSACADVLDEAGGGAPG